MKNNISIGLNIVLLIAVAVLYVLHFKGGSDNEGTVAKGSSMPLDFAVAYVNSDTLLKNYDLFKDLEKQLIDKRDKLNAEYENRAKGLQQEISNFQSTAGNMTISQARAVEEDLRKKQQNLLMYQEQLGQQLMMEEAKMNEQLYDKLADYLRVYGTDQELQFVLGYSKGGGVLYASDSLDITQQVIVGLNDAYKIEQSGGKTTSSADSTSTN